MINFIRSASKRNSLFQCPECGTHVVIRDINISPHSNSHSAISGYHCDRCNNEFHIEVKVKMSARVYTGQGQPVEEIYKDEIDNLF